MVAVRSLILPPMLTVLVLAAGCAGHPREVAVQPPPVAPIVVAMPVGGYPGMAIPAVGIDGRYPTPDQGVSAAAATWHLRAALNVAALACRGPDDAARVARYNALLGARKAELKAAEAALAAEYRAGGGDWQDRYDDAMTRLYNFFSQSFARDGFCRSADAVLADLDAAPQAPLAALAPTRLAVLDAPFTDFYRSYDAWRTAQLPREVIALTAATPAATPLAAPASAPRPVPYLTVDIAALGEE